MRVIVEIEKLERNIEKAACISNRPVALMFKDYYSHYFEHISFNGRCFSSTIKGTVNHLIGKANEYHTGSIVIDPYEYNRCVSLGISTFYIPINAFDNREGLSLKDARELADYIEGDVHLMITSGCLNGKYASRRYLDSIHKAFPNLAISLGGSFWLSKNLPDYCDEIRIGEYMIFGTIPYCHKISKEGECSVSIETNIIGIYQSRRQLIIDCGYSYADIDKCSIVSGQEDLEYIASSSDYSIFEYSRKHEIGESVIFRPNYKSLVKMRNAETIFK